MAAETEPKKSQQPIFAIRQKQIFQQSEVIHQCQLIHQSRCSLNIVTNCLEETHDCPETTSACKLGSLEYNRMPFGLPNARVMNQGAEEKTLASIEQRTCSMVMCYIDDIIIVLETIEEQSRITWYDCGNSLTVLQQQESKSRKRNAIRKSIR